MRIPTFLMLFTALIPLAAAAGSLENKSDQLCQRIQRCAWQALDGDNLPPDDQQQLKQSLGGVCQSIQSDILPVKALQIEQRAEACIDSMLAQSCDDLVAGNAPTRPCQQLAEELARR